VPRPVPGSGPWARQNGTHLLSGNNDSRITHVGRFLRKHKLDEIPNFINILKGEMTLIGPRPEQKYFTDQLILRNTEYALIQTIKPGITSWGQVK
jgi:lipopolysaccharide/colanic/teichoic acid biosynthesis glycosyltransferase